MDYNAYLLGSAGIKAIEKIFGQPQVSHNFSTDAIIVPTNEIPAPANVELKSYTETTTSEDGTYSLVKDHREWVEAIPQPRTPEEIQAELQKTREQSKIALGVGLAAASVVAGVYLFRDKIFKSSI